MNDTPGPPEPLLPPPFDPGLASALDAIGDLRDAAPATPAEVPAWRERLALLAPEPSLEELGAGGAFEVTERLVPGPAGAPEVPLVIARPAGAAPAAPVIYHAHGGGMIGGNSRAGLADILREWAAPLGAVVVSVEYRLAPEHPFPAGAEDCYAGLVWTSGHAAEIGGDPGRLVVAGGSAGGGLACALALMVRDREGPLLIGQLAMCPMLDDRNDTPSARQMNGIGLWDRRANHVGWASLLGPLRGTADVSPYAAPARAADLSRMAPAFIDVGSAETYRDEAVAYATRIWQAGGDAELHVWAGGFHGFDQVHPHAALSLDARQARFRWLRRILDRCS